MLTRWGVCGRFRESNPGPLAPKTRIMSLDHTAVWKRTFREAIRFCRMLGGTICCFWEFFLNFLEFFGIFFDFFWNFFFQNSKIPKFNFSKITTTTLDLSQKAEKVCPRQNAHRKTKLSPFNTVMWFFHAVSSDWAIGWGIDKKDKRWHETNLLSVKQHLRAIFH